MKYKCIKSIYDSGIIATSITPVFTRDTTDRFEKTRRCNIYVSFFDTKKEADAFSVRDIYQ